MNGFSLLAWALMMVALFIAAWAWATRIENYSLVDAVWAFGIGFSGLFWLYESSGTLRQWVVAILVLVWSCRLGGHLVLRIWKHHPQEDVRYRKLRVIWRGREQSAFFWFFQAQALLALVLAMPFWFIARDAADRWGIFESLGCCVALAGIFGEGVADWQMSRFKARNPDPLAVCEEGLWNYSRHPNYFFEALVWLGFYLFACGAAWGWLTAYVPAAMVYLLLYVTGIPPAEAAAVLRKGDSYRRYQQTTSAFVPLPKRQIS